MLVSTQPSLFADPDQRSRENNKWWKDQVRFVFSNYNKRTNSLGKNVQWYKVPGRADEGPVDEMVRMFTYYLGKQYNRDYYYTTQGEDNCALPTVWVNGKKIISLVDFMVGKFIEMIENIDPTVRSTSKAATNRKTQLIEKLMLKIQAPELFKDMGAYGVEHAPLGSQAPEFETTDDLYRFMESDYREPAEKMGLKMAKDILNRNVFQEKYKQAALFLLLGGVIGIENRVQNGREYFDIILPYKLIYDTFQDDDQHRKDRFVGKIDAVSSSEVIAKWGDQLTEEEKSEIVKLTPGNMNSVLGLEGAYNSASWATSMNGTVDLSYVTAYFIGMKDLRYEQETDKYGNTHYKKSRKKKSNYWTKTIYKATLIGNKYLVDFGECSNIVRDPHNQGDVQLPIHVFQPNMVLGQNTSVVWRLHQHQDRIDFYSNEMTKMITRAKGKVYYINKHKLGSATSQELLNDFTRMGFHIGDGNADGEEYTAENNNRAVEVVDMTLDPNVQTLVTLTREQERLMEEIVNIPKIAQGMQTGYVGAKTQAGTIAQSDKGTAYLYEGFIHFVEKTLRHALNQFKVVLTTESEDEIPVIGTKGVEYMKIVEDLSFEELDIYFKIKDFIDESARERLLAYAQALAQNNALSPLDMLNIERATTYSELFTEFKTSLEKRERDAKQQQAQVMMMQQMQAEQQAQAQSGAEQMRQEGNNYRAELAAGTKIQTQGGLESQ